MTTVGTLVANLRLMYGDTNADFISDTRGMDWINQGQRRFCTNVMPLDEIKDYTISTGVLRFNLPTNCIMPIAVMWKKNSTTRLEYVTPNTWYDMEEDQPNSSGDPDSYTLIRQQLVVGPQVPNTQSAYSTASGEMDAADTTLGLAAASGTFRSKGFVKVENEVIEFSGVSGTTLTGAIRGVHGTTAATHASGITVYEIDMQLTYRRNPAEMTATTSIPDIPEAYHNYLEKYALYLVWLARGDREKAEIAYNEFEVFEKEAQRNLSRRSLDGMLKIQERFNRRRWSW